MSFPNASMQLAIDIGIEAVEADRNQNYTKALNLYDKGVQLFLDAIKNVFLGEIAKESIKLRILQYLHRIERIKEILHESNRNLVESKENQTCLKVKGILQNLIDTSNPKVEWTDVAGLEAVKECIQQEIILPVQFHNVINNEFPISGILFYGASGTGKTYLGKAVANKIKRQNSNYFTILSSNFSSTLIKEPEKLIEELFRLAREQKPSVIFFDDLDFMCAEEYPDRAERLMKEFKLQMSSIKCNEGIIVLGSTNKPWKLHPTIRRSFKKHIYIPLPEQNSRNSLFKVYMESTKHTLTDRDFNVIAKETDGYSGADISEIVQKAIEKQKNDKPPKKGKQIKTENLLPITLGHLQVIIKDHKPSVDSHVISSLEKYAEEHQNEFL